MRIGLALLGLAIVAGCRSGSRTAWVPPGAGGAVVRAMAQGQAQWCDSCNEAVYVGHYCGLTVPCALCGREQGARHVHEIAWKCPADGLVMTETHVCDDARTCGLCRGDDRALLGPRACERCAGIVPPAGIRALTSYCGECNQEAGLGHLHGKTVFCLTCLKETGEGHRHDVTRLCAAHGTDQAPDHRHGLTAYCAECGRDVGEKHRHGETDWCSRCEAEAVGPHSAHSR